MNRLHETVVEAQFGPRARAYVESAVHADGEDLKALEELVATVRPKNALDLGAGGGHVSYRMAPFAGRVSAVDLSSEMLATVSATARERRLSNITTLRATVEALPFTDGAFDFLACRYSAHHWRHFDAGLREARRVLKKQSRAVFIDVCAPASPLFDTHLQTVELLRDASHVRNYRLAEWAAALSNAGFAIDRLWTSRLRMDFPIWTARMRTPVENVQAIRSVQRAASAATKAHFEIEADGSFVIDVMFASVKVEEG
ncbi:MAG TPA: class I SAM-dependent methyltransferase [Methylocystis sp.]|jgi:SAM-dependent methyltransferase